jgi:hypothetical protein
MTKNESGENPILRTAIELEHVTERLKDQSRILTDPDRGLVERMIKAEMRLDRMDKDKDSNKANYALGISLLVALVEIWKLLSGK